MRNYKYLLLVSTCVLFNNNSLASGLDLTFNSSSLPYGINTTLHTRTHTPNVELKPISNFVKLAAVCSLGSGGCDDISFNLDNSDQCKDEGYSLNTCNETQFAKDICPYNENYNKGCSCKSDLINCNTVQDGVGTACNSKYASCKCKTSLVTCSNSQDGVGESCSGKYASCQCKTGLIACNEVQVGSGTACGGKYTSCACKPSLISCTANQIGIGTGCGGKYASCTCPASWSTCSETGGASGALVCTTAGGTKYYNNCRPKDDGCPSGYTKSACNGSLPIETARSTTEAGSICYACRARTCVEENQRCPVGTWNLDFYYANQALRCLIK